MNTEKVKQTAARIRAFGREYTVQRECVSGFIIYESDPQASGALHEVLIFRSDAEIVTPLAGPSN